MPGHPSGCRDRILDGGGKFVFGSEAVADGNKAAARHVGERRADAVMAVDTAGDHAAAMEEHKTRQIFAAVIRRVVKTIRNVTDGGPEKRGTAPAWGGARRGG